MYSLTVLLTKISQRIFKNYLFNYMFLGQFEINGFATKSRHLNRI